MDSKLKQFLNNLKEIIIISLLILGCVSFVMCLFEWVGLLHITVA